MSDDQDAYYRRCDEQRMLASLKAKRDAGERLSRKERCDLAGTDCQEAVRRIKAESKGNIGHVAAALMQRMLAMNIVLSERLEALEDRIAAVEGKGDAAKPVRLVR